MWDEVQGQVYHCEWFQVYDIIERVWRHFDAQDQNAGFGEDEKASEFEWAVNDFFVRHGIGWQLVKGQIVMRGPEGFEAAPKTARATLEETSRPTAAKHIHEALQALSRPEPDLPGAI